MGTADHKRNEELHQSNLRQVRALAEKTQEDIAEYMGVSNRTVSAWECGTRELRADAIVQLCDYLGCTPNDLLGYKGELTLPKLDIYEERVFELVHTMNHEGKKQVSNAVELMAKAPELYEGESSKRGRSAKRGRSSGAKPGTKPRSSRARKSDSPGKNNEPRKSNGQSKHGGPDKRDKPSDT